MPPGYGSSCLKAHTPDRLPHVLVMSSVPVSCMSYSRYWFCYVFIMSDPIGAGRNLVSRNLGLVGFVEN